MGIVLAMVLAAGWLHADARAGAVARDCRFALADGAELRLEGRVVGGWSGGVVVEGRVAAPGGGGCPEAGGPPVELRVRLPRGRAAPEVGAGARGSGRWSRWEEPRDALGAGSFEADAWESRSGARPEEERAPRLLRWRRAASDRVLRLFPGRGPLVEALVLARKDRLDPALRESFVRAGAAHLLAISGFHVGVVALLVLGLLRLGGLARRPAAVVGAAVVWCYVLFIGAPDAAVRAAILLTLAGAGVLRGRPVHRAGALSAGLLVFLVADPGAVARIGFQLSFAGAAGLVLLTPRVERLMERAGWRGGGVLRSGVAVGVAATVATIPFVAWHFEEVSTVGIPVSLLATPVVAVAIPGILATLAADAIPLVPGPAADFLAGGADLILLLLVEGVAWAGGRPWSTVAVPPSWLLAAGAGAAVATLLLAGARGVGRDVRLLVGAMAAACGVLLQGPADRMAARGSLEVAFLDVGQGDAIAVRTPRGRWILVDAGPGAGWGRAEGASAAPPAALRQLRRRGVGRLAALLLTHPDMDHVGGAAPVIEALRPELVADPGHVRGTAPYLAGLRAASLSGAPWSVLRAGEEVVADGVRLEVLHPAPGPLDRPDEPNESSLVLLLRWRGFRALLTGDAGVEVEEAVAHRAGDVDVLKVGHHGSRTSSSVRLLEAIRPEVAVISAGRRNRYGHPHPEVLGRLQAVTRDVPRTDRSGTVRILVGEDGDYVVLRESWEGGAGD